jgi:hypothetical protein
MELIIDSHLKNYAETEKVSGSALLANFYNFIMLDTFLCTCLAMQQLGRATAVKSA